MTPLSLTNPLTAVMCSRRDLVERLERLFPRHSVFLHLCELLLVLCESLLLVLGDQAIDVRATVTGGNIPGRAGVDDPRD